MHQAKDIVNVAAQLIPQTIPDRCFFCSKPVIARFQLNFYWFGHITAQGDIWVCPEHDTSNQTAVSGVAVTTMGPE